MKRYLTIARQVAKEKMGTKDDSVNSDEVESEREHFVTLKEGYSKVNTTSKTLYNEHWPSFLTHNAVLSTQLLSFSESLKGDNLSSTSTKSVADALEYVGNGLRRENEIAGYCVQSDKSGFVEAAHKICDIYIKDVNELRSKQELARLQLSHTLGQLKNLQKKAATTTSTPGKDAAKLQQVEQENLVAQAEYNSATSLFIEGMDRLEGAGRSEFVSSLTSMAEAHLRSMEDGVAMWKDILANLEQLDERESVLPSASPPTTPTTLQRSTSSQSSTPVLPPKPSLPNPGTPKPSHTPLLSPPLPSPPSSLESSSFSLETSNHANSFDPFGTSSLAGDPMLRRNSSPKPPLDSPLSSPTLQQSLEEKDNIYANNNNIYTNNNNNSYHFEPQTDGIGIRQGEQEEYEELAL